MVIVKEQFPFGGSRLTIAPANLRGPVLRQMTRGKSYCHSTVEDDEQLQDHDPHLTAISPHQRHDVSFAVLEPCGLGAARSDCATRAICVTALKPAQRKLLKLSPCDQPSVTHLPLRLKSGD